MAPPCTVLIAAPDLLPALTQRIGAVDDEVLAFTDADALRALQAIVSRRPATIALERQFAATPRGAALINRIKADPALLGSELRIVSHDSDYTRVLPRPAAPTQASGGFCIAATVAAAPAAVAVPAPLDQRGTRRAPRFKIAGDMSMHPRRECGQARGPLGSRGASHLADGAQTEPAGARVLTDDHGALRFNAAVAWAFFEIAAKHGPQYRAGVNFVDADGNAVGGFCVRHKQS